MLWIRKRKLYGLKELLLIYLLDIKLEAFLRNQHWNTIWSEVKPIKHVFIVVNCLETELNGLDITVWTQNACCLNVTLI